MAAERGGDWTQTMESEGDPDDATLEQAIYWSQIYTEILGMEEKVLKRIRELMATQSATVQQEVELTNVPVVVAQAERFRQRLGYWQERVDVLVGDKKHDGHADGHAKADGHADGHAKADGHVDGHAKADGHVDGHAKADGYADGHAKADGHADGHAKADGQTDGHAKSDGHSKVGGYVKKDGNLKVGGHS